ncbi:TlpA family protein disulfide reductase [Pedobacter petrophilus]|uniref:TlpA family protein disulfide reductase n=1 Tax=Pedobacter petrophilus TaxID=1908241 RepID=UPI001FD7E8BD|nr:TlpA disulfide reductase family protein [Pedobacter petrophilus]
MKWLKRNSINIGILTLLLVMILIPDAKATLIRGLMTIGFFKPNVEEVASGESDLSGLKFKDVKGNVVDLGDLKGKVVFLNFWATWCPPCRAEMPSLKQIVFTI